MMRKQFRSKKNRRRHFFLYILVIISVIIMDNMYLKYATIDNVMDITSIKRIKIDIDPKKVLMFLGLNHIGSEKESEKEKSVFKEYDYNRPTIYLYNTHQTEEYSDGDIYKASQYLKDKLLEYNIDTILESTNVADELKKNNWVYKDSYKVTRELLLKNINDNIALYIDLHRDSSSYQSSTVEIDSKKYAKVLFVIGGKHDTFESNYLVAENLNKLLKNFNNKISRGIFVRKSSSYNQDINSNCILIEIGGPHNSMEEVKNTIDILSEVLAQFIGE